MIKIPSLYSLPLRRALWLSWLLSVGLFARPVHALEYFDNDALQKALEDLAREHRDEVQLRTLARSSGQRDIWQLEISAGPEEQRGRQPALLVVAGIEGDDLAGTSVVVQWLRGLLKESATNTNLHQRLAATTLYVFPRLNPDSATLFFGKPQRASNVNLDPVDEDHDGLQDEDPPEDLNGDGLITAMRVEDADGDYILDPVDPRLMLRADPLRGEHGAWRLLTEGVDNDQDEAWNEDGIGGVNLNRNFPYNYRYFAGDSGFHPMSQAETRALAEFVLAHDNIAIAFTFGAADNLVQTPKSEGPKRPPVTIHPDDAGYYRELGKAWRNDLGLKKELSGASQPGAFSDWIYYHRGRLSLAAQPWSPALQLQRAKPAESAEKTEKAEAKPAEPEQAKVEAKEGTPREKRTEDKRGDDKREEDKRNEEERQFLRWLDGHAPGQFVAWHRLEHPDFPGRTVEVGGYAPFARVLPPPDALEELADAESGFLTGLLSRMPRLQLRRSEVKPLGQDLYDITIVVENVGFLPTSLAQGDVTDEVHPTRLTLDLPAAAFLSGSPRTLLGPLAGSGGSREVRVVVHAPDRRAVELEVISMLAGTLRTSVPLSKP